MASVHRHPRPAFDARHSRQSCCVLEYKLHLLDHVAGSFMVLVGHPYGTGIGRDHT